MKLLCIKQESFNIVTGEKLTPELIVGKEYTVSDVKDHPEYGRYYNLNECEWSSWFHHTLFAEVTDLDETELVTEEFEEKYCVPANK